MKTTFGSGVIITSKFLNGAKNLRFDGKDEDWHYSPLGLESLQKSGEFGLDSRYLTRTTEQNVVGRKNFLAPVHFGTAENCVDCGAITPKSFASNHKWFGGTPTGSISRLDGEDIITKTILEGRLSIFGFRDLQDYSCSDPTEGNMLVYRSEEEKWSCSDEIDGGTY